MAVAVVATGPDTETATVCVSEVGAVVFLHVGGGAVVHSYRRCSAASEDFDIRDLRCESETGSDISEIFLRV